MTDREIFKLALDCLENAVDLQQSEIDMHILHYGEWYRPQRVEFMKKYLNKTNQSIEAIRARLEQPEQEIDPDRSHVEDDGCPTEKAVLQRFWREHQKQEPVAQVDYNERGNISWLFGPQLPDKTFLYTAPPQREWCQCKDAPNDCTYEKNCRVPQIDAAFKRIEWQGLTDQDYEAMAEKYVTNCYFDTLKYARAIEAKLKEKNHG